MEYLILILILPLSVLFFMTIFDEKNYREYKKYIDSIKVGDIFVPNFDNDLDDPFAEKPDYSEYSKVIVDIKKNNKGETWVKYKLLKNGVVEFTEEIGEFAKTHKKVEQSNDGK